MTRVIIRRFRKTLGNDLIAFFPDIPESNGCVMSYQHIGQHGIASYPHPQTIPVSPDDAEAAELMRELRSIGYDDLRRVYRR